MSFYAIQNRNRRQYRDLKYKNLLANIHIFVNTDNTEIDESEKPCNVTRILRIFINIPR